LFQAVASSLVGEDSLSHHVDPAIGVYIIDRYTYYALEFLEKVDRDSKATMGQEWILRISFTAANFSDFFLLILNFKTYLYSIDYCGQ
jgi:glycosylphosphatidylinositol transamidase (GPIT) subunit GPI8